MQIIIHFEIYFDILKYLNLILSLKLLVEISAKGIVVYMYNHNEIGTIVFPN